MFRPTRLALSTSFTAAALLASTAAAVDLESFEFNDANGTQLTAAVNTANPGNFWSYEEEATTPGDETTGDPSDVQSGAYRIFTDSSFDTGLESRYLDIANVSSGTIYLSATLRDWNFSEYDGSNSEQLRFTFLDDDTGTSGSTVSAQMQIRRNADTGAMELFGDAIGTAGSFDIANTVEVPNTQNQPFQMVLAIDKTSNSYEIFYKDGTNPSQVLGLGGVSRARDANSIRIVTNNFGAENFLPFVITEEANLDRIAVSDTNPLTDLVTLTVDRATGAMSLVNNSGAAVAGVTGVTLESAFGAIDLTDFSDFSGTLANGQTVALDSMPGAAPGLWVKTPVEDVRAELTLSGGGVRTLDVDFIGNGGLKFVASDFDFDGDIDADDYAILQANAETDLAGLTSAQAYQRGDLNDDGFNDATDFSEFKDAFIAANGAPAFARMIAGVPEPATSCLVALGFLGYATRRRRPAAKILPQDTPMTHNKSQISRLCLALAAVACLAAPQSAEAIIFQDFQFNDTAGTLLTEATNSINPTVLFDEDQDTIDVMTNGLGQLDASLKANTGFGTNYLDIEPAMITGTVYGVMELTWDFQSVLDTAENEEIRLSFINNNPRGTEITAQYQIIRTDTNVLTMQGDAIGAGSSNITPAEINGGSLTQTEKFIAILAADFDNDSYEVLYSNNAGGSFLSLGSGTMNPDRGIESVRLTLNNDLSGDNVLIDRLYLTDELPDIGEIDTLTLRINTTTGTASIVNGSESDFDIDYYRILSGDDSLIKANWNSLQNQAYDAVDGDDVGSTAGDGVGEVWTEAGGSDSSVLSESFLLSSSLITSSTPAINLGAIFDTNGDGELLEFEYRSASTGTIFTGEIEFVAGLEGDFNDDGVVDAIDYAVWREGLGSTYQSSDFVTWRNNYGGTSGAGSGGTQVPEPNTLVIVTLVGLLLGRRRRTGCGR